MSNTVINVRIDQTLKKQLSDTARRNGTTASGVIKDLIRVYIAHHRKKS